ncbi:MAG: zinc-ribbon and DUF3426 domain-containing protein [Betaproteobacteria bacterium]
MTMFTRCTHCGATFRVTLEQLQTSSGQVRCGVCDSVFDAFVALSANDPRIAPGPAASAPEPYSSPPPAPAIQRTQPVPEDVLASIPLESPESLDLDLSEVDPAPTEALATEPGPATGELESEPEPEPAPASVTAPASPFQYDVIPPAPPRPRRSPAWSLVAVALALAFVLQAGYFFRDEVAASLPETRPPLEAICARLGCDVPLPRLADRLSIEASDLQALDPARPNRVVLSATIRNRAGMIQALPMLELTLTNSRDQVAARKVFTPAEYLNGASTARGLAANGEVATRLRLDTGDIVAAGYRIYLFHP